MNEFKDLIGVLKDISKELYRIRKNQEKQMETDRYNIERLLVRLERPVITSKDAKEENTNE